MHIKFSKNGVCLVFQMGNRKSKENLNKIIESEKGHYG